MVFYRPQDGNNMPERGQRAAVDVRQPRRCCVSLACVKTIAERKHLSTRSSPLTTQHEQNAAQSSEFGKSLSAFRRQQLATGCGSWPAEVPSLLLSVQRAISDLNKAHAALFADIKVYKAKCLLIWRCSSASSFTAAARCQLC